MNRGWDLRLVDLVKGVLVSRVIVIVSKGVSKGTSLYGNITMHHVM